MPTLRPRLRKKTASSPSKLVVGLRNPGSEYAGTRHNIGHAVVLRVVDSLGERFGKAPSRVRSMIAQHGVGDDRVMFLAPNTFMNESGGPVRAAVDYYGLAADALLVVHDDIDLPFGRLRIQVGGGSGGHNGIRSVEERLGTKEFSRLKVGVGRPPGSMDPATYVLRGFSKQEEPEAGLIVADAADVVRHWLEDPARAQEEAALRDQG